MLKEPNKFIGKFELYCRRVVEELKPKIPSRVTTPIAGTATMVPAVLQLNDLVLTYASQSVLDVNPMPGLIGQNLNPTMGLLGQNFGVGVLNPGV